MTDYILPAFDLIFQNALNLTFADGLIYMIILFALIFSIQDFRIGAMFIFLINICGYIFYTLNGFPLGNITIMVFLSLLVMAFSLFFSKGKQGGVIG